MQGQDIALAAMAVGGWAFVLAAAPAMKRRVTRTAGWMVARACGELKPFAGRAHVIDGDTLAIDGRRVRLFGMDAPEMGQRGGAAARAHLIALIEGATVEVAPLAIDIHGRTVARVRCAGRDLSRAMVRDGYARASLYWSWAHLGAEIGARLGRRGLWVEGRLCGIEDPFAHRRRMAQQRRG